jgi:hypothetical protein
MKSKWLVSALMASACFGGAGFVAPALAQNTQTPRIDRAQEEIGARIEQGVESGRITRAEAQELYQRERAIGERENRYKADGYASAQERQLLRQDLDALRADVERAIVNPRVAPPSERTPGIDRREAALRERIDEGVRSGQISERAARRLYRQERRIEREEARAKADGVVTRYERRQLRQELMVLNNDLERALGNSGYRRY